VFLGLWRGVDAACILEQESPADATVTCDSAIIPSWPPATILDFIEPQIGRGVYPYLLMATNAPWSIFWRDEKSILGE